MAPTADPIPPLDGGGGHRSPLTPCVKKPNPLMREVSEPSTEREAEARASGAVSRSPHSGLDRLLLDPLKTPTAASIPTNSIDHRTIDKSTAPREWRKKWAVPALVAPPKGR